MSGSLEQITESVRNLTSADISLPVNELELPRFQKWINWSGFKGYSPEHLGFDFAAYLTQDGKCILGLPKRTRVRAVADGTILEISHMRWEGFIIMEHQKNLAVGSSAYWHVQPLVEKWQVVKRGEVIAGLYWEAGHVQKLVHLHLELNNDLNLRAINPCSLFPQIGELKAIPQGTPYFQIPALGNRINVRLANCTHVSVNNILTSQSEINKYQRMLVKNC